MHYRLDRKNLLWPNFRLELWQRIRRCINAELCNWQLKEIGTCTTNVSTVLSTCTHPNQIWTNRTTTIRRRSGSLNSALPKGNTTRAVNNRIVLILWTRNRLHNLASTQRHCQYASTSYGTNETQRTTFYGLTTHIHKSVHQILWQTHGITRRQWCSVLGRTEG